VKANLEKYQLMQHYGQVLAELTLNLTDQLYHALLEKFEMVLPFSIVYQLFPL